ncbi:hypothetical protein VKT23_015615 [Stygiomarasmius scandens]|uniref:Uncharacterized protein n=1 Tax=Marasmiellus scandens TaxID=2682957 RepID=A0ABR1IX18_9AGAR
MDTDSQASPPMENHSMTSDHDGSCDFGAAPPPQPSSVDTNHQTQASCTPPFFPPLNENDEYDVYDLELMIDSGAKSAEIFARSRSNALSTGRPIYKAEKKARNHFLGKKNLSLLIFRSDGWDSIKSEPVVKKGKGYVPILETPDTNPRTIHVVASKKNNVLAGTSRGGDITVTSFCGNYDPQKSRTHSRDNASFHYFPLHITDFERVPSSSSGAAASASTSTSGSASRTTPAALTKRYSGGGYFVFDADNHGRKDLLCTLYCTGYEKRHQIRQGDIAVAELRLTRPAIALDLGSSGGDGDTPSINSSSPTSEPSLWKRLFRERHVSLHISKRGLEAALVGGHVNMTVPNPLPKSRYTLTVGQGQEIVISVFMMSILGIEHEGLESKKWAWLQRPLGQAGSPLSGDAPVNMASVTLEKYDTLGSEQGDVGSRFENMSLDGVVPRPPFEQWKVATYNSAPGVEIMPTAQPVAISTEDEYVKIDDAEKEGYHQHVPQQTQAHAVQASLSRFHQSQTSDASAYSENYTNVRGLPVQIERSALPHYVYPIPPPPPHPLHGSAIMPEASWIEEKPEDEFMEYPQIVKKDGPKVTGKPKPGAEGGIYW